MRAWHVFIGAVLGVSGCGHSQPPDPSMPVVRDVPARCVVSDVPIFTSPEVPAWASAAALARGSAEETAALAPLLGSHRHSFMSSVLDAAGWVPVRAEDTLEVTRGPDGGLAFALALAFDNGHACFMNGTVDALDATSFRFTDEACHVHVTVSDSEIRFEDEYPSRCATSRGCGARGVVSGSRIPLEAPHRGARAN